LYGAISVKADGGLFFASQNEHGGIIGSFNNGAVGTALGQANGIQALDRTRQVVALTGDGGFNMLMCEFLTAVQHKLPVKVVIYNSSAFGLIRLEAEAIGVPAYMQAIEFPNPDFAAFARASGGSGFAARKPDELKKAISDALAVEGPAIIDATVAANELPNLPHLDLEQIGRVAFARVISNAIGQAALAMLIAMRRASSRVRRSPLLSPRRAEVGSNQYDQQTDDGRDQYEPGVWQ
jgi:thiamine pyrophosphate-dependent acetolactate synthase large subunit-like protein